jgi:hypothetical protein
MNILQALKRIKHVDRKIKKIQDRISRWCSHDSEEKSPYEMEKLIQSVADLAVNKATIRSAMHATNIATLIEYKKGNPWTLDALLAHRTLVLPEHLASLKLLRRKEKGYRDDKDVKYVLNYDVKWRDQNIDAVENEMAEIDDLLDATNISTELVTDIN